MMNKEQKKNYITDITSTMGVSYKLKLVKAI